MEEVAHEVEEDDEDGRRKKKKKKKEKRVKMELIEEILKVKQEPVDVFQEAEHPVEKSKKKKKKKDREVEEGQQPSVKVEQVSVKCEPMDSGYGDVAEFQQKKKKKKKKHKTDED